MLWSLFNIVLPKFLRMKYKSLLRRDYKFLKYYVIGHIASSVVRDKLNVMIEDLEKDLVVEAISRPLDEALFDHIKALDAKA